MQADRNFPFTTSILTILTLGASLFISWRVNGALLSTVRIVDLAENGGVRFSDIRELKLWRFFTAQLVHVRWPHMLFNVACLFGISWLIERKIGSFRTLAIWVFAGGTATLFSPIFIAAPYNVGTGASHAVLAFAGCALVMWLRRKLVGLWPKVMLSICLVPAFMLDFVYVGHPKIGHVIAVLLGMGFGYLFTFNQVAPKNTI